MTYRLYVQLMNLHTRYRLPRVFVRWFSPAFWVRDASIELTSSAKEYAWCPHWLIRFVQCADTVCTEIVPLFQVLGIDLFHRKAGIQNICESCFSGFIIASDATRVRINNIGSSVISSSGGSLFFQDIPDIPYFLIQMHRSIQWFLKFV